MSRYIEIDTALLKTVTAGGLSAKALWKRLMQQPTIDIVRCSECVHYQVEKWWCKQWTCGTPAEGWCYMGKATVSKMEQVGTTEDCSMVGKE